jgi:hypothetical protein
LFWLSRIFSALNLQSALLGIIVRDCQLPAGSSIDFPLLQRDKPDCAAIRARSLVTGKQPNFYNTLKEESP